MHPHLIDWFRNPHIQSDPTVIEKRWETALEYSEGLKPNTICSLLRIFLFSNSDEAERKNFEDRLLTIDTEFPITGNKEELRLMAGVVMVATFVAGSKKGIAFALGLKAADFPGRHLDPAQPEVVKEAENFFLIEAERMRPGSFDEHLPIFEEINVQTEITEGLENAESSHIAEIVKAAGASCRVLENQIRRLAEESALLWWVVNEYSSSLNRRTAEISSWEYVIVSAAEAAERTHLIPPPRSAHALLTRALKLCVQSADPTGNFERILSGASPTWRAEFVKTLKLDQCGSLLPIVTGLAKSDEFGSTVASVQVLPKLCPGVDVQALLSPSRAAFAAYCELMFIKALNILGRGPDS